jgi:hypothetical protein
MPSQRLMLGQGVTRLRPPTLNRIIRLHEQDWEGLTPGAAMDVQFTRIAHVQANLNAWTHDLRRPRTPSAVHPGRNVL